MNNCCCCCCCCFCCCCRRCEVALTGHISITVPLVTFWTFLIKLFWLHFDYGLPRMLCTYWLRSQCPWDSVTAAINNTPPLLLVPSSLTEEGCRTRAELLLPLSDSDFLRPGEDRDKPGFTWANLLDNHFTLPATVQISRNLFEAHMYKKCTSCVVDNK